MKLTAAIDAYLADQRAEGRINSPASERIYRQRLLVLAEDVHNRDPRKIGREDVKRTLGHWPNPNTRSHAQSIFVAFFDWCMEEDIRKDNPARQIRRAKKRQTTVYRLNRDEVIKLMRAATLMGRRQRWVVHLGVLAGARNQELRGFRGRHFARDGWVHFSEDIAKGHKEAWVPVLPELEPVVAEIRKSVGFDEFVIPSRRPVNPPINDVFREYPDTPCSADAIWRLVVDVALMASIAAHVHPHLLRHAYGDYVAKYAGLKAAQALMRHENVNTTASTYIDRPTLDELAVSVMGFAFDDYRSDEDTESPMASYQPVKKR